MFDRDRTPGLLEVENDIDDEHTSERSTHHEKNEMFYQTRLVPT